MRWHGFALALVLLPAAARADPILDCSLVTSAQVETADCLAEMETRANAALDLAFQQALSNAWERDGITGRDISVPAVKKAQTVWTAFRDAQCDYIGALFGGGSGTGIAIRSCQIEETRRRTDALLAVLN